MRAGAGTLNRNGAATRPLPRLRAPIVFVALMLLFFGLAGRSLYLQWLDNGFLQEQGATRFSRRDLGKLGMLRHTAGDRRRPRSSCRHPAGRRARDPSRG